MEIVKHEHHYHPIHEGLVCVLIYSRAANNTDKHIVMNPQLKSTKPPIGSAKRNTLQFGQVSENAWRISGKTMTIDEFIDDQRQYVNSTDLSALGAFSDRLLDKLKETNADDHPGLREAVHVIVQVLELPAAQQAKDPLPTLVGGDCLCCGLLSEAI